MKNKRKGALNTGKNSLCPCGSGIKYAKCCFLSEEKAARLEKLYQSRLQIRVKKEADVEGIRQAGRLAIDTLDMVEEKLKPGLTTEEINTLVHEFTIKNNAVPAPLHYKGFPKSVCVSVNEVVCHGIPGNRVIEDGDIVNVDVTPILNGYYADTNKTFFVGTPGKDATKIVNVARGSLKSALAMVVPGNTIGDIGWAIQRYVEERGCSVVREFVGHGVGLDFHEPPQVPHYGRRGEGIMMIPGMVFTIEPMINLGGKEIRILADNWTAVTRDGSLTAQFEQTIVVTREGFESLTPFDL